MATNILHFSVLPFPGTINNLFQLYQINDTGVPFFFFISLFLSTNVAERGSMFFFLTIVSTSCLISHLLCRENFSRQRHFNITDSKLTEFRLATNLHFTTFE